MSESHGFSHVLNKPMITREEATQIAYEQRDKSAIDDLKIHIEKQIREKYTPGDILPLSTGAFKAHVVEKVMDMLKQSGWNVKWNDFPGSKDPRETSYWSIS